MSVGPPVREFADEVEEIAGRAVGADALAFLRLATQRGAAMAAAKQLTVEAPAHWDSLAAAALISDQPAPRWLQWRLRQDLLGTAPRLDGWRLADQRAAALLVAAERAAPPGPAGWFTPSAQQQIVRAAEIAAPDLPLGADHLVVALLAAPASGHDPGILLDAPTPMTPHALAGEWARDLPGRFDPRFLEGYGRPEVSFEVTPDPDDVVAQALRRLNAGGFDERLSPIRLLAALDSVATEGSNTLDADLAALARGLAAATPSIGITLFARAAELARRLGEPRIGTRHLIGAVLAPDQPELPPFAGAPAPPPGVAGWRPLRTAFLDWLADAETDGDRLAEWAEALLGGRIDRVPIASDGAPAADLLGFERHARAIAAVLADRDVAPPLAIGLFGHWGSGKSAMIALIKSALGEIEARALRGRRSEFCRGIVMVDFNAWHYAESSLWASLFVRILEGLAAHLRGAAESLPGAEERARLLLELEVALREQQQAEAELLTKRAEAESAARDATAAARIAEAAERRARSEAAEAAARQREAAAAQASLAEHGRELQAMAGEVAAVLGVLGGGTPAALAGKAGPELAAGFSAAQERINAALLRTQSIGGKLLQLWRSLSGAQTLAVIAVFFLATALAALLASMAGTERLIALPAGLLAALAPILPHWRRLEGVLGQAELWATRAAAAAERARSLVAEREAARAKQAAADEAADAARRAAAEVASAQQAEAAARRAERAAESVSATADAARNRVAALRDRIDALAPVRLLESFVGGRAASDDYARHLGLPTLIRRDIEGLRAHLAALQRDAPAQEATVAGPAMPKPTVPEPTVPEPTVQRIVLFIDDLDRCPREVVVKVLEAVHILLTFDLFNVVVGVDVRWLTRALARHHQGEFGGQAPVDPLEYLEKIFQIPFWVPGMTEAGRGAVLGAALPAPVAAVQSGTGLPSAPTAPASPAEAAPVVAQRQPVAPLPPLAPVALLPDEHAALLKHGRLAGDTPRRLKRFARSYLILRASLPPAEREAYVAGRCWEEVTWLLAAGCALPGLWPVLAAAAQKAATQQGDHWGAVGINDEATPLGQARTTLEHALGTWQGWPNPFACGRWLEEVARFGFGAPLGGRG